MGAGKYWVQTASMEHMSFLVWTRFLNYSSHSRSFEKAARTRKLLLGKDNKTGAESFIHGVHNRALEPQRGKNEARASFGVLADPDACILTKFCCFSWNSEFLELEDVSFNKGA